MLPSVRRKFIGKKNKRLINRFKFRKSTTWRRYNKRKKLKNKRIAKRRKLTRKSRYKKSSAFLLYNKARIQRGESFLFFYRSYINEKGSLNPRSRKDIVEILKKYLDIFSLSTLLLLYNPTSLKNLKGSSIDPQINSFIELIELRLLPFFNIQLYNTESFKKILSTFSVKVQKIFIFVLKYVKKILKIQKITELYEKGYVGERDFVKLIGELNKKVVNKRKEDNIMIGSMAEGKRTTIKKIKGKLKSALYPVKKKKKKRKKVKRLKTKKKKKSIKKVKKRKKVKRLKTKKTKKSIKKVKKRKKKVTITKKLPKEKKEKKEKKEVVDSKFFKKLTLIAKISKFFKILKKSRPTILKRIKNTINILIYLIMKLKEVKIKNKKKGKKKTINNILKSKNIEFILKGFNMNLKASKILTTDRLSYIETAIKIFNIFSRYNLEERQNLSKKNIMLLNPRRSRRSFVNIFLLPWAQIKKREKRRRMRKTNLTTRQRFSQKHELSMYKLWRLSRKTRRKYRGGLLLDFLSYFELGISKILKHSNFIMTEKEALNKIKEGNICINGKTTKEPKHRVRPFDIVSFHHEKRRTERSNFLLRLVKGELHHSLWGFFEYNFRIYCFMFLPLYLKYKHKLTSAYLTHLNKGRFFIEKR